jgi:hypothetical protein
MKFRIFKRLIRKHHQRYRRCHHHCHHLHNNNSRLMFRLRSHKTKLKTSLTKCIVLISTIRRNCGLFFFKSEFFSVLTFTPGQLTKIFTQVLSKTQKPVWVKFRLLKICGFLILYSRNLIQRKYCVFSSDQAKQNDSKKIQLNEITEKIQQQNEYNQKLKKIFNDLEKEYRSLTDTRIALEIKFESHTTPLALASTNPICSTTPLSAPSGPTTPFATPINSNPKLA